MNPGLILGACIAPLLLIAIYGHCRDRLDGFYAGWDPDKDWSTRGAPWQRAKRRAYRNGPRPLTPDEQARLAMVRAYMGDPDYFPGETTSRA